MQVEPPAPVLKGERLAGIAGAKRAWLSREHDRNRNNSVAGGELGPNNDRVTIIRRSGLAIGIVSSVIGAALLAKQNLDSARPQLETIDDRLVVELFAEHPDIVTPVGMDVDDRGRVYVLENNTHQRPEDYTGPRHDRVLLLEDTTGDGRADARTVYHDGLVHGNGLKISPAGDVFVSTRSHVFRLEDTDDDGVAESRQEIVALRTETDYPHNGLSGLAFDFRGRLYIGMGENFGARYELVGSDGLGVTGEGEGGNVFRCEADGSGVERIAEGFWNPWGLTVDVFNRLMASDNDPHSSPPSRLLHVVEGGHYGFEYRYGRSGLHPLQSWEGQLPGMLPMAAPMSQAPCGIVTYESDLLPGEYWGKLLAGIWSDRRVEMFHLRDEGATFRSTPELLVQATPDFRPVGIAVAPDGSVYLSDWVYSDYRVHQHGRIWRIRPAEMIPPDRPSDPLVAARSPDRRLRESAVRELAQSGTEGLAILRKLASEASSERIRATAIQGLSLAADDATDFAELARKEAHPQVQTLAIEAAVESGAAPGEFVAEAFAAPARAAAVRAMRWPEDRSLLLEAAASDDPYMRTASWWSLSRTPEELLKVDITSLEEPAHRLAVAIGLKRSRLPEADQHLAEFIEDPDPAVRFLAAKWAADRMLIQYRPKIEGMLTADHATPPWLFRGVIAALDHLDGLDPQPTSSPERLADTLFDEKADPRLRRLALEIIDPASEPLAIERLRPLIDAADRQLRLAAVRALQLHPSEERFSILAEVAADKERSLVERAEAVVGLAGDSANRVNLLMELATGEEPALRAEALRALVTVRFRRLTAEQQAQLTELAAAHPEHREAVLRLRGGAAAARPPPDDLKAWVKATEGEGDPELGRRLFFSPGVARCYSCHRFQNRGTQIGPDLTRIHLTMDREQLLESMLQPNAQVAPQFELWEIRTTDGQTRYGTVLRKGGQSEIYIATDGSTFSVRVADIEVSRPLGISFMPPGLPQQMTSEELRGLLSLLMTGGEE